MSPEQLSEKLSEFLIELRTSAKLTQQDIAARSDVFGMKGLLDQRTISRIEKQPLSASAVNIGAYMTAVGRDPSEYFTYLHALTYNVGQTSMDMMNSAARTTITRLIQSALTNVQNAQGILENNPHPYLEGLDLTSRLADGIEALKGLDRKPVIGFFGHFDAGKSTLINTIIDSALLPARYQPATCVVNLLMHEDDRPEMLKGQVALFKKGFMPHMIHDPALVKQFLIEDGDKTILDRLGVHNYDDSIINDAYIAVVFSTAAILERAWLLDTPGNLNDEESGDSDKALGGVELVDGIAFLSKNTGFMSDIELYFGAQIIRQRPPVNKASPLEHVLFVQSHCHSEISPEEVKAVGDIAFKRCKKQMEELVFESWLKDGHITEAPSPAIMGERVQPFWRENESYRTGVISRINEMVDYLTKNHTQLVEEHVARINKQISTILTQAIADLEAKKQGVEKRVEEVQQQDARFRRESDELVKAFHELIDSCSDRQEQDLSALRNYYDAKTSVESLTTLMEESFDDKKTAQREVGNYIGQMLTATTESTLKTSSKVFANELDALLIRWQKSAPNMQKASGDVSDLSDLDLEVSGFNSRAAFIGGLSGLGSLGAMSLYVSTIASNLGAYILVGKAAGVLTSLGLAGSVTSVTSFVAAIGGPVTVGIAIAAMVGYIAYRLVGGSWQKSLAKKVHEAIEKDDVWSKIEKPVIDFWKNTATATKAGLAELIAETERHIEQLKADAKTEYDINELALCIDTINKVKALF